MHTQSASGPRGPEVNVLALDELVTEYLRAQHGGPPASTSTSGRGSGDPRADTWAVRGLLRRGRVGDAVALIQEVCPSILEDHRLLFRLRRQEFVELLRRGSQDGDSRALDCARDQLAPLALGAYPEAYTDFKAAMLMLVQERGAGGKAAAAPAAAAAAATQQGGAAAGGARTSSDSESGGGGSGGSGGSGGGGGGARSSRAECEEGEEDEDEEEGEEGDEEEGGPSWWREALGATQRRAGRAGAAAGAGRPEAAAAAGARRSGLMHEARQARSKAARRELSEVVFHTMRQQLGWLDPPLCLALRYLLLVAAAHADSQSGASLLGAEQPLADALLEREPPAGAGAGPSVGAPARDAAPLQSEATGMSFPEGDVLDLMQGARVPRTAAWDALKRARGNLGDALTGELMRLRLDEASLLGLAEEYAAYRGLSIGGGAAGAAGVPAAGAAGGAAAAAACDRELAAMDIDAEAPPAAAAAAEGATPGAGGAAGAGAAPARSAAAAQQQQWGARSDSRSPPYKVPRWGPPAPATGDAAAAADEAAAAAAADRQLRACAAAASAAAADKRQRAAAAAAAEARAPLLRLAALAAEGAWDEARDLIETHAPGLLKRERPELLFDLHRLKFAALTSAGDAPAALALARAEMAPLADAAPALLPALKAAMASLLPGGGLLSGSSGGGGGGGAPDAAALAAAMQEALAGALGLEGPRLGALIRGLLAAHRAWFRLQRCADPFAPLLGIDRLRADADRPASAAAAVAAAAAPAAAPPPAPGAPAAAAAAPNAAANNSEDGDEDGGGDEELDEGSVLRLMEILEVPRGLAIELLAQHHGSVEDAVMQVVAG